MTIIRKDAAIRIHVTPEINPQYQGIANAVWAGKATEAIRMAENMLREEGYPVGITGNAINVLILELDEFTFGDVDGPSIETMQTLDIGHWTYNGTDTNPRDEGFICMNNISFEDSLRPTQFPKIMLRMEFVRRREDTDYQRSMFNEMVDYMDENIRHYGDSALDLSMGARRFCVNFPLVDFDHYYQMMVHLTRKHNEHRCKILPGQLQLNTRVYYETTSVLNYIPVWFSFQGTTR